MNKTNLLFSLPLIIYGTVTDAAMNADESIHHPLPIQYDYPDMPSNLDTVPLSTSDTLTEKVTVKDSDSILPFFGKDARARGYNLPEPFGVNVNYINIRQNIDVENINFNGLGWDAYMLPSNLFNIKVDKTRQRSTTKTIRLDAWILPFMNVYGIVGKTHGSSLSKVSVDSDPSSQHDFMSKLLARMIHQMNKRGELQDLDFKLDFRGTTYGAGTVLVGGYGDWFGLLDMNYTQTRFDILDGSIDAFTLSPRVGYRFTLPSVSKLHPGESHLNLWVGSMYQSVQQEFKGNLNDLNMPVSLKALMQIANPEGKGRFDVKQHLESPWNILVGANYELTRSFNITTEVGFSERNSFFLSGEYRF